ncbi:hypothetical protein HC251_14060 [Iamia sp. SCSIO 61187]|uniref:hypothetical protein n=1 Tax=Iamia sp. SCSIO 61187 TaxID=2722752 RepID=UPI001C631B7A|nr:hypothetical protein [Iamia sp. SCSIO 61187]QYG93436.1 hypothetical protein HC251_14060 [Iamia sp. SCSIO 61187]
MPFTERTFAENWLQELIQEHPTLLPVDEIRASIGPLTSLGREVPTTAGQIDNLLVDPNGTLVIIETKLWRNPQARRDVVGQVIDYAAALCQLSFDELDHAVRLVNGDCGIADLLGGDDLERQQLIDGISRGLRSGDLVLLVVGDGIREEIESIADLLGAAPHLGFTFGLIELAVYDSSASSTLVIPTVVAHSVEITRTTVRVEVLPDGRLDVKVAALNDEDAAAPSRRQKLDAETFAHHLSGNVDPATLSDVLAWRDQVAADPRLRVDYASKSMIFRVRPVGIAREFTGLLIEETGNVSVGWLHQQVTGVGAQGDIATKYAAETAMLVGAAPPTRYPDTWGDGTGDSGWVDLAAALARRAELTERMLQVADELERSLHN